MIKAKNLQLTISAILITMVSFAYGVLPDNIFPVISDFKPGTTDLKNIFRAIMGLYVAMVFLWVLGISKPSFWRTATISNLFFMLGLAAGRLISICIDGIPSVSFTVGFAVELLLGIWAFRNLHKYGSA